MHVLLLGLSLSLLQSGGLSGSGRLPPPPLARAWLPQMNIGEVGGLFMRRMSQMSDQRVAHVSTILISFDTEKTLDEAYACFETWKAEIGDDPDKFAEVARRESEDSASAPNGGDIGFVTRARQLPPQLDDVVFRDQKPGEERPGVCKLHCAGLTVTHSHTLGASGRPHSRTNPRTVSQLVARFSR